MSDELNPYEAPAVASELPVDPFDPILAKLRTAAIGMKIMYFGVLAVLLTWLGAVPFAIFGGGQAGIASLVLSFGIMIAFLLVNVGPLICLTAPPDHYLRAFVILTVAGQLLSFGTILVAMFYNPSNAAVSLVSSFSSLFAASIFLIFLYRIGKCIHRNDIAKRARNVFIIGALSLFVLIPVQWLALNTFTGITVFGGGIAFVAILVTFVMYANLINATGTAILKPRPQGDLVGIG